MLHFAANDVCAHWKKPPSDPLPETRPTVLLALADFFLCAAQRIFIVNLILLKKYVLVPNLLMGLMNKYEFVLNRLILEKSQESYATSAALLGECAFIRGVCTIFSYKFLSLDAEIKVENDTYDDTKNIEDAFAQSVGYARLASKSVKTQNVSSDLKGAEILKKRFKTSLKTEISILKAKLNSLEEENNSVYYAAVNMEECELPSNSQYKFLMVAEKFQMPVVKALSFEQIKRAPPGIDQKSFEIMPSDIQDELIREHAALVLAQEEGQKKKGGLFGFGKKKKKDEVQQPIQTTSQQYNPSAPSNTNNQVSSTNGGSLVAPPGVDPIVFASLPRELQLEVLGQQNGNAAPTTRTNNTNPPPSNNNNGKLW